MTDDQLGQLLHYILPKMAGWCCGQCANGTALLQIATDFNRRRRRRKRRKMRRKRRNKRRKRRNKRRKRRNKRRNKRRKRRNKRRKKMRTRNIYPIKFRNH